MKKPLVLGLGKSGKETYSFFKKQGIIPYVFDDNGQKDLFSWENVECLVLSPGVPHHPLSRHPIMQEAILNNIPVVSELDLYLRHIYPCRLGKRYVGVTGTNGKSTTTALLTHLWDGSVFGGNIGVPFLALPEVDAGYVFELSSYQLDISEPFPLDIAIFLNLTPDHIERHHTLKNYLKAKERVFINAKTRLIGIDDEDGATLYQQYKHLPDVYSFSSHKPSDFTVHLDHFVCKGTPYPYHVNYCRLYSDPQRQNIAAASLAFLCLGGDIHTLQERLQTFKGLPHRQEIVCTHENITIINDSKATNGNSSKTCLQNFNDVPIFWILGGIAKADGIEPCRSFLHNVKGFYIYGRDKEVLKQELFEYETQIFETLDAATDAAICDAKAYGKTCYVILSPACASLDQFQSFEHRGDKFKEMAKDRLLVR